MADLAGLAVSRAEPRREWLMLHADRRPRCTNSQLPPRHQSETGAEHGHLRDPKEVPPCRAATTDPLQPEATTQVPRTRRNARERESKGGRGRGGRGDSGTAARTDLSGSPSRQRDVFARLSHGADLTSKSFALLRRRRTSQSMQWATTQLFVPRLSALEEHVLGRAGELEDTQEMRPSPARGRRVGRNAGVTCPAPAGSRKSRKPTPRTAAQPPRAATALARTEHRLSRAWELAADHELAQGEEQVTSARRSSTPKAVLPSSISRWRRGWPALARAGQWHAPGVAPSRAWELHDEQARMKNKPPQCARAYL